MRCPLPFLPSPSPPPPCLPCLHPPPHPARPRQVLVYNLPEAIRESDLEKLSFAVELSKAFYSAPNATATAGGGDVGGGTAPQDALPIQPGSMVWLIQRDFLQVGPPGGGAAVRRSEGVGRAGWAGREPSGGRVWGAGEGRGAGTC